MNTRKWWKTGWFWTLTIAGLLFAAYLVVGFFLVPRVLESRIRAFAGDQLELDAQIEDTAFNPLTFRLHLQKLRLREAGEDLFSLDSLALEFDPLVSLVQQTWSVGSLQLQAPHLYLHVNEDNRLNWKTVLDRLTSASSSEADTSSGTSLPAIQLDVFTLKRGVVEFSQQRRTGTFRQTLSSIDIQLENLSTGAEELGSYRFAAEIPTGGSLRSQGSVSVDPVNVNGKVSLDDLPLMAVDDYLRPHLPVILADGQLSLETEYRLKTSPTMILQWNQGRLDMETPVLRDAAGGNPDQTPLFSAGQLSLRNVSGGWSDGTEVSASGLNLEDPDLQLIRRENGRLNWQQVFSGGGSDTNPPSGVDDAAPGPGFTARIDTVQVNRGEITWVDRTRDPEARTSVRDLSLRVRSLQWPLEGSWPYRMEARAAGDGRITASGSWQAGENNLESDIEISALPLNLSNDYLNHVTTARWTTGSLNFNGRLNARIKEGRTELTGAATFDNVKLVNAEDRPVLSWDRLNMGQVHWRWPDLLLRLNELTWSSPSLRLFIGAGYRTNLQQLMIESDRPRTPPEDVAEATRPGWQFDIGPIQLSQARIDFTDENVPGGFSTMIYDLGGTLGRLDTSAKTPMSLDLSGRAGEQGRLAVKGAIQPLAKTPTMEVTADFRNLGLVPLSPYSMKFAGYRIDGGKMRLDLGYSVRNQKLTGRNHVVLEQLRLGEQVPGEPVISAPIKLAVALLKNDQGVIDLNIPVSGNLDDPTFSLGSVIRQAVTGTIRRIVGAPFRFLAQLVGGQAEDLQQLGFEPGRSQVDPKTAEHLRQLAAALNQRPEVRLEIRPGWSEADRNAFAREKLDRAIESSGARPTSPVSSRPVLEDLFLEEFNQDQLETVRNEHTRQTEEDEDPALNEETYVEALYERLIGTVDVDETRLDEIGRTRARNLQQQLQEFGVDPERVFILDVKMLEDGAPDRVNLPVSIRT